jgi:hypothetical protein
VSGSAFRIGTVSEAPAQIQNGDLTKLETLFVHNPSEAAGAYVKLYALAGAVAPTGSAVPIWSAFVPAGPAGSDGFSIVLPVFVEHSDLWIAAAAEAGAGLTAPASDFEVSATRG